MSKTTKRMAIPTERTIESVSSSVPKLSKVPTTKQRRQRRNTREDQKFLHTVNLEEVRIPPHLDVGALPTSQTKRNPPKYVTVSTVSFSQTLSPETPLITLGNAASASKRVLILAGVHGDEPCGLIAFNELLEEGFFDRVPSDIHITALVGNPLAVAKSQRFVDVNLNRMVRKDLFHTGIYESERARVVADAIDKCDILLDLHSCSADAPPHALPMDDPESMELASRLPVGFVIRHLAHTTPGKATTLDWAKEKGIVAVGVECGQHEQRSTVEHAKNCIKTLLEIVGDKPISTTFPPCKVLSCKENEPVRKGFQFSRNITAFEKVPYGELIASDEVVGKIFSKYPGGTYIVMPTRKPVLGEEAWYYAELVN